MKKKSTSEKSSAAPPDLQAKQAEADKVEWMKWAHMQQVKAVKKETQPLTDRIVRPTPPSFPVPIQHLAILKLCHPQYPSSCVLILLLHQAELEKETSALKDQLAKQEKQNQKKYAKEVDDLKKQMASENTMHSAELTQVQEKAEKLEARAVGDARVCMLVRKGGGMYNQRAHTHVSSSVAGGGGGGSEKAKRRPR
jgi:hypothetical protein